MSTHSHSMKNCSGHLGDSLQPVMPIAISAAPVPVGDTPDIMYWSPLDLHMDASYQLTDEARRRVDQLVTAWDWGSYRLPIVRRDEQDRLVLVAGHEVAIAAATLGVGLIPVRMM